MRSGLLYLAVLVLSAVNTSQAKEAGNPAPLMSDAELSCVNRSSISSRDIHQPKAVTLNDIRQTPGLADKLKSFFDGHEVEEGKTFISKLSGTRLDPANCWTLLDPNIDILNCQATKPAGDNRIGVKNGALEIFVDGKDGDPQFPVPLWSICSDGKKTLRFKFLYHRTFMSKTAGPWEYTVEVTKNNGETTSLTKVREVNTGNSKNMNVGKIAVTKFEVIGEPQGAKPQPKKASVTKQQSVN